MKHIFAKSRKQMLIVFNIVVLLCVSLTFFYFSIRKADAAWFDDAWQYRVAIPISDHTAAQSNVYLDLTGANGINTTDTTKFQADCGDIRFTDASGNLLPYYLTTACGLTQTGFHVLLESFPAGAQTIYYYYGNPTAPNGFSAQDFTSAATGVTLGTRGSETKSSVSPLLYWSFDEGQGSTINDFASSSRNGSLGASTAAPTWVSDDQCVSGKCLQFDGVNDYAYIADNTIFTPAASGFTISAWINPNTVPTGARTWIATKGNTSNFEWALYIEDTGTLGCEFWLGDGSHHAGTSGSSKSTIALSANTWQHVECTYNISTGVRMYLNGVQGFYDSYVYSTQTNGTAEVELGKRADNAENEFKGKIDEFRIYSFDRTAAQVKSDYGARGTIKGSVASLGSSPQNGISIGNGLVGYWKLDESASPSLDSSGNGTSGTWTGAITGSAGKFGNAASFTTTGKYIDLGVPSNTGNLTTMTLSAWINPTTFGEGNLGRIIDKNTQPGNGWGLFVDNSFCTTGGGNRLTFIIHFTVGANAGRASWCTPVNSITTGQWTHVSVTYDRSSLTNVPQMYINGKQVAVTTFEAPAGGTVKDDSAESLYIGNRPTTIDRAFDGKIDELRIYKRILSTSEITRLYDFAPGPVGYWQMDENNGTSTIDATGNSTAATMTNMKGAPWVRGVFGAALDFQNTNDVVNAGSASALDNLPLMTVSAWVKPRTNGNYYQLIDKSSDVNPNGGWIFEVNGASNTLELWVKDTNGGVSRLTVISSNNAITPNVWQYVTFTWIRSITATNVHFYVNGIETGYGQQTDGIGGISDDSAYSLAFGSDANLSGDNYDGLMDEVKVYNYIRTQKQIVEDMNGGHPPGGSPIGSQMIYWKFDEMNGSIINNSIASQLQFDALNSGGTWSAPGSCKVNGCLNFTSSANYVNTGDIAFVDGLTSMTASLWINPQTLTTDDDIISKFNGGSGSNSFLVYTSTANANQISVAIASSLSDNMSNYYTTTNANLTTGAWTHIAVVYDGSLSASDRVKVYKNGILLSGTVTGTIPASMTTGSTSGLGIGDSEDAGTTGLIAYYDEVKIYTGALTRSEILVDFNAGSALSLGGVVGTHSNEGFSGNAPIGYWKLDEPQWTVDCSTSTALDSSGNNYNMESCPSGTGPAGGKTGKFGRSGYFDGVNDYLTIVNDGGVFSLSSVTIGAWIKAQSDTGIIVYRGHDNGDYHTFRLMLAAGHLAYTYTGNPWSSEEYQSTSAYTWSDGWHHVAATFTYGNGSTMQLYRDGVPIGGSWTGGNGNANPQDYNRFNFGYGGSTAAYNFTGYIDSVVIYNYIRTPAQVAYDYNRGQPITWLKINECSGSVLYNSVLGANGRALGNDGEFIIGSGTQSAMGDCAVSGTTPWYTGRNGKYGASVNLDGSDDYIRASNSLVSVNSGTAALWVNPSSTPGTDQMLMELSGSPNRIYLSRAATTGNFVISLGSTTGENTSIVIPASTWTHVALTWNNGTYYAYINGKSVRTNSYTGLSSLTGTYMYIGSLDGAGGNNYPGLVDDVRAYNYAMTADQLQKAYNEGSAVRFGPATGTP